MFFNIVCLNYRAIFLHKNIFHVIMIDTVCDIFEAYKLSSYENICAIVIGNNLKK